MRWIAAGIVVFASWAASGCATALVGVAVLTNSRHFNTDSASSEFALATQNYSGPDAPLDVADQVALSDDDQPAAEQATAQQPEAEQAAAQQPEAEQAAADDPAAIASDGIALGSVASDEFAFAADQAEEILAPQPAGDNGARPGAAAGDIDRFNRPVADVPLDINPPQGVLPVDQAAEAFAGGAADPRDFADWPQIVCSYTPWTICYRPLYFEEIALERYGDTHGLVQPVISGAHFFGSVALLPYKMTVRRPRSCVCSNGFSRPGDCPPPGYSDCVWRWDAALVEAAAVTGFVFILP